MGNETNRIDWIDAAKGIGIILVLIGHCNIKEVYEPIYMFHMPLFFVISGLCWKVNKNKNYTFKEFAQKKWNSYIIPYFKIAAVCFLLFGVILEYFKQPGIAEYLNVLSRYFCGIVIFSYGNTHWLPNCSPIWFLTCLFCVELIFWFIMRTKHSYIFVAIAGLMGYVCSKGINLPWNIDTAFTAIPFLYVGVLIKKYVYLLDSRKILSILIPLSLFILLFGVKGVNMDGNHYDNFLMMYVQAFVCVMCLLSACKQFGGVKYYLSSVRIQ